VRTRFSLLIPAVALATALTACGDDGPNKTEFVAKADAACAPGNAAVSTTAKPTNAPQVSTAAGTASTTIDGQVGALRALKMPSKDKTQIQAFVAALADVSVPTKALQDAAGKNDDAAMAKAALDMQTKADAAATSAQAYGLAQCGTQMKFGLGNMFDGVKNVVKATYVSKAAGLCRDFLRKADAVPPPGNSLASAARALDAILVLQEKLTADLKALPVPPGDEGPVKDYLAALDTLNTKTKEFTAAAKANNGRLVVALNDEFQVTANAVSAKFDAYGLEGCGTVGD
jgi:predicted small lipoprotein YifL